MYTGILPVTCTKNFFYPTDTVSIGRASDGVQFWALHFSEDVNAWKKTEYH